MTAFFRPSGSELPLDEFAHFASALANQPDDHNIGGRSAGDGRQKRRLAGGRFAEDPDALAARAGDETVNGADAERKRLVDDRALHGLRRQPRDMVIGVDFDGRPRLAIERLAEGVQDAAQESAAYGDAKAVAGRHDLGGARKPGQVAERGQHRAAVAPANHLGPQHQAAARLGKMANLADAHILDRGFDNDAEQPLHAPLHDAWRAFEDCAGQTRNQALKPLFRLRLSKLHAPIYIVCVHVPSLTSRLWLAPAARHGSGLPR